MTIRMNQANQFFFLSAVAPHINASVKVSGHVTMISFTDVKDVEESCPLVVMVYRTEHGFKVGYDMEKDGIRIQQAESDYLDNSLVAGVIASVANDAFKGEAS
jgi:hypothetical protein